MEMRLNICDLTHITLEYGSHHIMDDGQFYKEKAYNFEYAGIQAEFTEIILKDFRISYGNGSFGKRTRLDFDFKGETVEMHFTLRGSSSTTIEGHIKEHRIEQSGHNLFYCKDIQGHLFWESPEMLLFEVNLKPEFFEGYLPNSSFFDNFKNALHNGDSCYLHPDNYPITPQMRVIIQEMMQCHRTGVYKKMFLESKVMELLLLQLEQIHEGQRLMVQDASKGEIEKMHHARQLILANLKNPLSLNNLAKALNTNECTLKKNFKKVFGNTVFGYIQDLKMNEAKTLLLEQDLPIYQIADMMGYKNPQHFSFAFKKKFGFPPSNIKK